MKLRYSAFDRGGKPVSAVIDAPDVSEGMESLRRDGLYVVEIAEVGEHSESGGGGKHRRIGMGGRLKFLATFSRQLCVLVSSGTPLVQSLNAVERQASNPTWRGVMSSIRERVEEGMPLSEAMKDWPEYFDPISRSLVAAGESSGNMSDLLQRLSVLVRKQLHLRNSIISAMIYPSVLVTAGFGVLMTMMFFVLPRFVALFDSLGVPLPPTTRFLIGFSGLLRAYWWIALPVLIALPIGIRSYFRTEGGRQFAHRASLRLPKVGNVLKSLILARVTRLLGVLLDGHVSLLEALSLTKQAAGNVCYAELITRAEDAVSHGDAISSAFADTDLVSPSVHEAIRSGEHSGNIGGLLLQIADTLDEDNEIIVRTLTSVLEPLILIGLGILVAFIAISMFLPLFDLAAMSQGGSG
jgi:type IV pilus assembly protein PilC